VEDGDVHGREDREGADDDGVEEESVPVDISKERKRVRGLVAGVVPRWVEAEHAAPDGLKFPRGDEDQPCDLHKDGRAGAEDDIASVIVGAVAVLAKNSPAGPVNDDDEGEERAYAHDGAVDEHVHHDLPGENAALVVMWWACHDVRARFLATETEGGEGGREHVDPEDL